MVRRVTILIGIIPIAIALLIGIPQLTKPEVPISASDSNDIISIEYSIQHLKKFQVESTETLQSTKTELLIIQNDGEVKYSVTTDGTSVQDTTDVIEKDTIKKLKALIKETGFMQVPKNSFTIKKDVAEYDKFGIKVNLNVESTNVQWPEQNATSEFIPPLLLHVKDELDKIISEIIE